MRKILAFLVCCFICVSANAMSQISDTQIERYLKHLVEPLATASGMSLDSLTIHIVNADDFNAFVMSGQDAYIYTGLLTQIKSPSALQAVVAHEMGHTLGGHMVQLASRQSAEVARSMIIQALGVGLMAASGEPSLGAGVLAGASGVANQSLMAFTRDEERMADKLGLDLMVSAGLDANGFIDVFNQMNESSYVLESRINPNRINHPLTAERLQNVQHAIDLLPDSARGKGAITDEDIAEFELMQAKLIGYLYPSRVSTLYPYSDKSNAAIFARAIANLGGGNYDLARTGTNTLISRQPKNPYFYELLADIEFTSGNLDTAIVAYDNSLKYAGAAPQIQTALALVLVERSATGDVSRAIELARRAILTQPTPLSYWVLSRAYTDGRGDWARAEYYHMLGNSEKSQEYARRAIKSLPSDSSEYLKSKDLLK